MTTTRRALLAALALLASLAACGGDGGGDGAGGTDDGVASIDDEAAAAADEGDGDGEGGDGGEGGDADGGGGGPAGGPDPEFQDAVLEFAECMREHGVDMPDPDFGDDGSVSISGGPGPAGEDADGGGGPDPVFEAADEACSPIMEEARPEVDIDPEEQAEMQDRMIDVAECMRGRGYDMPDPEFTGDGGVRIRAEGPPEGGGSDDEFQADMEACHEEAGVEGGPGLVTRSGG